MRRVRWVPRSTAALGTMPAAAGREMMIDRYLIVSGVSFSCRAKEAGLVDGRFYRSVSPGLATSFFNEVNLCIARDLMNLIIQESPDWQETVVSEAARCGSKNGALRCGRGTGTSKFGAITLCKFILELISRPLSKLYGRDHLDSTTAQVSGSSCQGAKGGFDIAATWHVNRVFPKHDRLGK
ncbi:hypothetical protein KIN20_013711 [Parelaphostrongylus tenuis]|uniref:Uncharacterized protein n=1 Tax=Parelaphostrongylus tenuis TaxID=148309 RepID=A0AAD5QNY5_PARTN|nr:hypothetical protein KIN20_013711 [Parelaphostrongylus tenuis]